MSDNLSLDDILIMYVQESKEHLETIENDLLVIEKEGIDNEDELINKMFRAAHSIKGGSGFWDLDTIKNLAHKTENVLDMIRKQQMDPTPDVVSIILKAFDRLGELLDDPQNSNGMDISAEVGALQNLTASNLPENEKMSVTREVTIQHPDVPVVFPVTEFDVQQSRKSGHVLYILEFDLLKDVHRQEKTPMDFLASLEANGNILDIIYDLDVIGDLDNEEIASRFPVFVLYSTFVEPDLISNLFVLDVKYVHIIEEEDEIMEKEVESSEKTVAAGTTGNVEQHGDVESPSGAKPQKVTPKPLYGQSEFLRVQVHVLDQLMNRAGELVLARNQLMQAYGSWDKASMKAACQRVDVVTSELQESIMLTRMQPVNNIFSKFPRMVRDLSLQLGKQIELVLEGKEVEVDKTIIEGLGDPLTHLVRNSVDHGIEMPELRNSAGKSPCGIIKLRAFHESGQIIIEITDDGQGINPETIAATALEKGRVNAENLQTMSDKEKLNLIMLPGFSTAEAVTDVSGRGVGMDVVKTNLDKMGGHLELDSQVGKGVTVRIKLPLTLAIIPSLLISSSGERFALPQINIGELLRIPAAEIRQKIEKVSGADVLILRGELIPLLQLNNLLELRKMYFDPKIGEFRQDRRAQFADERVLPDDPDPGEESARENSTSDSSVLPDERRYHPRSDINIIVLQSGPLRYGLVVDEVHDTVEIVVKPLGRHLTQCSVYAGATIMGDGRVALILDVPGLAHQAKLSELSETTQATRRDFDLEDEDPNAVRQSMLLFHNGPDEFCAVPLHQVLRVEQIEANDIEIKSNQKVIRYRGGILPIFALEEVADVENIEERDQLIVIIFQVTDREVGLLAVPPLDVIEDNIVIDEKTLKQVGITGSTIIKNRTTMIIDIVELVQAINPHWFDETQLKSNPPLQQDKIRGKILLVEDSHFFRAQVKSFIEEEGYSVVEAEDGQVAWDMLCESPDIAELVLTDIEMPRMNGFELIEHIKNDERVSHLPVIALTTLAEEADVAKGMKLGVESYHIKMDKENLMRDISKILQIYKKD